MIKPLALALGLSVSVVNAAGNVTTCRLGPEPASQVKIIRSSKVYDTHLYTVQLDGQKKTPLFGDNDNSRGSDVQIQCVGKRHRALVISGEFTANALQGIMFTYNQVSHKTERLEFAEKSRPSLAYLGESTNLLIIQTNGLGESNKKYVVYRQISDQEATTEFLDDLPSSAGFDLQSLK